jgi:hypothetical protein
MAITTGQCALPVLAVDARVEIGHHFARDALILDVGVSVREATPLFPELGWGHLDLTSALNEFLQFFCH